MTMPELNIARDDEIGRDEWLAVATADRELRPSRIEEEKTAHHWVAHTVCGEPPWFAWFDGSIDCELLDRATLRKALVLASRLRAAVTDDAGIVYTSAGEFGSPPAEGSPPPNALLHDLLWSFPDVPSDRAEFDAAVWQGVYDSGNDGRWDPESVVLASPRVCVRYHCWRDGKEAEPMVCLTSDNGESFTTGELLFKVHQAVVADLRGANRRFLEGLKLHSRQDAGQPPLYMLGLGS